MCSLEHLHLYLSRGYVFCLWVQNAKVKLKRNSSIDALACVFFSLPSTGLKMPANTSFENVYSPDSKTCNEN